MAHSKQSNTCVSPPMRTSKLLSYALPHTSHVIFRLVPISLLLSIIYLFPVTFFRRFVGAFLLPSLASPFLFTARSVDSVVFGSGFALKRSPIQCTGGEPHCSITSFAAFVSGTSFAS